MTQPNFGIQFNLVDTDAFPPTYGDFSVLGLVLPSDDADADMFPLNTAVDVNTGAADVLAALGTGPLAKAVLRVNAQLTDLQRSARAVIVRVAQGANDAEARANIVGDAQAGTGLYALLKAPSLLGVTPRLIGAPGYTGYFATTGGATGVISAPKSGGNTGNGALTLANPAYGAGVKDGIYRIRCVGGAKSAATAPKSGGNTGNGTMTALTADSDAASGAWRVVCEEAIADGGTFVVIRPDGTFDGLASVGVAYGSAHGVNFTLNDGATDFVVGDEFVVTVADAVPANGGVFSLTDPDGDVLAQASVGVAYTGVVKFTIADGATDFIVGDGFDLTVTITAGTAQANPICAALPAVCEALLAHAIVGGPGTTKTDAIAWRTTLNSKRLIPVDNWEIVQAGVGTAYIDGAAAALGIGVRVDFRHNGYPFWSFANQPVQGLLGLKRTDSFSLVDGATDAQELLGVGVGVTVRGDFADTALTDAGWQFIAYKNAADTPTWELFNKSRGRDFIHLALLKSIRHRLGAENVTLHGVQAVLNDMQAIADDLKAKDCLIGWKVGFRSADNTVDGLRAGKFTVFFDGEQPAPILVVTIQSGLDTDALVSELAALDTQLASAGG